MTYREQNLLLLFTATVLLVVCCKTFAAPTNTSDNCAADFQTKFKEMLSLKQSCKYSLPKDCCQIANTVQMFGEATTSKLVYTINDVCAKEQRTFASSVSHTTLQARCDTKDGWLVILRRKADVSPLVDFNRTWVEYEEGFGTLETEFWYGLKNIHCLTKRDDVELKIELKQNDGADITWTYQDFRVDGLETNYVLHIGQGTSIEGSGYDYMAYHNNRPFSTKDRDNDASGGKCTHHGNSKGGWWYNACFDLAPTKQHGNSNTYHRPVNEYTYYPHVEMKICPKSCLVSHQPPESCE